MAFGAMIQIFIRMNLSASDFQPVWDTVLQTAHMPAIISGRIFSTPCPASSGVAAPCANDPHPIKIDRVTTVFPNGSFNAFDAYLPPSNTNKPLIELDWLPRIANLIQVIVASIRIDLGNPSPNNFILHPSALSRTLSNTFPAVGLTNSTDSLLYQANVHPEIYGIQGMLPLTLAGPARIQVVFLCRFQQWKAFGALFISVLVATLSMFASGWALFMLLASSWVKRGSEAGKTSHPICFQKLY
jgi:hypothetical protein